MSIPRLPLSWSLWVTWLRFLAWTKRHAGLIRRIAIIAASIGIGLIVDRFICIALKNEILANYLVASGAMIGGATAVVLSLSIFLLQGIADLHSSRYFDEYANDWRQQATYLGIAAVVVALFGVGLYVVGHDDVGLFEDRVIISASLGLVGVFFALIDLQLEHVRRKVVPANTVVFLETRAMQSLRHIREIAHRVADIVSPRFGESGDGIALATAYGSVAQPYISDLDLQMEMLSEMSLKLVERKEIETAKRALGACGRVLAQYVENRSGSTIAIPSAEMLLVIKSDSQRFLDVSFQRLNRAGRQFMKAGHNDLSPYVIDIYRQVADKAKDVKTLGRHPDNPVLDSVLGYLKQYIDSGLEERDIEVVFQGAIAYGDIAAAAAIAGQESAVFGIQTRLGELAQAGLQLGETTVIDQCTEASHKIIVAAFTSDLVDRKLIVEQAMNSIAGITILLSSVSPISNDLIMENSIEKGFFGLYIVVNEIGRLYGLVKGDPEKRRYRRDLVMFFEAVRSATRKVADGTKVADSLLAGLIGRLIFELNKMSIGLIRDKTFADVKDELYKVLKWFIHTPYFFTRAALKFDAGSNAVRDLVNAVAKTGVLAERLLRDFDLLKECVSSLDAIVDQSLEKNTSSHGYEEPRLMKSLCCLGVLALRNGWTGIVNDVRAIVKKFEAKYYAKYFSSPPKGFEGDFNPYTHNLGGLAHGDQLLRELAEWMNNFEQERLSGTFRFSNDAEGMLYEIITPQDIEAFINAVWEN